MCKSVFRLDLVKTALCLSAVFLIVGPSAPAHAWDCDVHIALAMRAKLPFIEKIPLYGLPGEICLKHKCDGGKILQRSRRANHKCTAKQAYFEFVHGSQDPDDDDFRSNLIRERSHQNSAPGHAIRSFNASLRSFVRLGQQDLDTCGPEDPFATLGRSMHYLQDWGDPTKYLDNVTHRGPYSRKSISRQWANKYANDMIAGRQLDPKLQTVAREAMTRARDAMQSARTPSDILRAVEKERIPSAKRLREEFHRLRRSQHTAEDIRHMDEQVAEVMVSSMAYLEMAQKFWLVMWKAELIRLGANSP